MFVLTRNRVQKRAVIDGGGCVEYIVFPLTPSFIQGWEVSMEKKREVSMGWTKPLLTPITTVRFFALEVHQARAMVITFMVAIQFQLERWRVAIASAMVPILPQPLRTIRGESFQSPLLQHSSFLYSHTHVGLRRSRDMRD